MQPSYFISTCRSAAQTSCTATSTAMSASASTIPRSAAALRRELAWEACALGCWLLASIFSAAVRRAGWRRRPRRDHRARATAFEPRRTSRIPLEANPTGVEAGRLDAFASRRGRRPLGVQSLDDATLQHLGRQHSTSQARAALATRDACSRAPRRPDLRPARPDRGSLARGAARGARAGGRPSLALSSSPSSRARVRGAASPRRDRAAGRRHRGGPLRDHRGGGGAVRPAALRGVQLRAPGTESRHNLAYWRYADYAGIGPGPTAASRSAKCWRQPPRPRAGDPGLSAWSATATAPPTKSRSMPRNGARRCRPTACV